MELPIAAAIALAVSLAGLAALRIRGADRFVLARASLLAGSSSLLTLALMTQGTAAKIVVALGPPVVLLLYVIRHRKEL